MDVVYPKEKPLFLVSAVISILFWLILIVGTVGIALLYILFFFLFYLFAQSAFISYIRGTGVRITAQQFPDLHERLMACCAKFGMANPPEAYLMHGDGVFNALATRFLGRHFIVLYSDVVDALEASPGAVNFYIGHELGHIHRNHLWWMPLLFPAGILPLLGAAYSRAREYTCDRYGLACVANPQDAVHGLAALAAGAKRWRSLSAPAYIAQGKSRPGFWMSFHELTGDYPWLVKRVATVEALANKQKPRHPRRNPFAFLIALFVPRLGIGGGAGSILVVVAVIGILAAIAIPAYRDYGTRAALMSGMPAVEKAKQAVAQYATQHGSWPTDPASVGLQARPGAYGPAIESVELDEDGVLVVTLGRAPVDGRSFTWVPQVQDGRIVWQCINEDVPTKYLPPKCR